MSNNCQTCDNGQRLKAYLDELPNTDDQVKWMQWITKPDGYIDKVSNYPSLVVSVRSQVSY